MTPERLESFKALALLCQDAARKSKNPKEGRLLPKWLNNGTHAHNAQGVKSLWKNNALHVREREKLTQKQYNHIWESIWAGTLGHYICKTCGLSPKECKGIIN